MPIQAAFSPAAASGASLRRAILERVAISGASTATTSAASDRETDGMIDAIEVTVPARAQRLSGIHISNGNGCRILEGVFPHRLDARITRLWLLGKAAGGLALLQGFFHGLRPAGLGFAALRLVG